MDVGKRGATRAIYYVSDKSSPAVDCCVMQLKGQVRLAINQQLQAPAIGKILTMPIGCFKI